MDQPVNGKTTVVLTGATAGIGRALAHALAARDVVVLGCGRDPTALAELRAALGPPHAFAAVDIARPDDVQRWADDILAAHGAPDLLVNCAAVINPLAPLWQQSAADIDRVVDINLKGTISTIRAFVPAMIARGRGVIVNFSSGWGQSVDPDVTPYCATKWAIEGLTRGLALELPAGLAAVALSPGVVDTAMLRACLPDVAAPTPEAWARLAAPQLLALDRRHNGRSITISD